MYASPFFIFPYLEFLAFWFISYWLEKWFLLKDVPHFPSRSICGCYNE